MSMPNDAFEDIDDNMCLPMLADPSVFSSSNERVKGVINMLGRDVQAHIIFTATPKIAASGTRDFSPRFKLDIEPFVLRMIGSITLYMSSCRHHHGETHYSGNPAVIKARCTRENPDSPFVQAHGIGLLAAGYPTLKQEQNEQEIFQLGAMGVVPPTGSGVFTWLRLDMVLHNAPSVRVAEVTDKYRLALIFPAWGQQPRTLHDVSRVLTLLSGFMEMVRMATMDGYYGALDGMIIHGYNQADMPYPTPLFEEDSDCEEENVRERKTRRPNYQVANGELLITGQSTHYLVVHNSAYQTWVAVLHWLKSGEVKFALLTSIRARTPPTTKRRLRALSPKSVYRLAHRLGLKRLCEEALTEYRRQLKQSPHVAFGEVCSHACAFYPESLGKAAADVCCEWV